MGGNGWQWRRLGVFRMFVRYSGEYLVLHKKRCQCLPVPRGVAMGGNGVAMVEACSGSVVEACSVEACSGSVVEADMVEACSGSVVEGYCNKVAFANALLLQQSCVCKLVAFSSAVW